MRASAAFRSRAVLVAALLMTSIAAPVGAQDDDLLPAGARLTGAWETLPKGIDVAPAGAIVAEREGTTVALGVRPTRRTARTTVAAVRDPAGAWRTVTVDTGNGIAGGPAGSTRYTGVVPIALVAGDDGLVALGRVYLYPGSSFVAGQAVGLVWTSPDGRRWRRIDLRTVLGQRTSFVPEALVARPDGGYLLAGSAAALGFQRPSTIVVLSSDDGRRWRRAATIDGTWSVTPAAFHILGDQVVLTGFEYACESTSEHQRTFSVGAQLRAWTSDSGRAWDAADLTGSGVITVPQPAPAGRRGCPRTRDLATIDERFASSGRIVGVADGAIVAMSDDVTRVAISRDLTTWTAADLPGAVPSGDEPGDRGLVAVTAVQDPGGGVALLSVERRRDAEGAVEIFGHRVLTWRSADGGVTWEQRPSSRGRVLEGGDRFSWFPTTDGARLVVHVAPGTPSVATLLRSEAGPPDPATCTPAPGADCAFTELGAIDLAGRDLTGIDLSGAKLEGANLDGADLTGADLRTAAVGASMRGTRLVGVRAEHADLEGDLAGADLTDADLAYASLTGSSTHVADARGLDLRPATLRSTSLIWLDLTGARIGRKQLEEVSFIHKVICPDGQPSADSADPDPCRLR